MTDDRPYTFVVSTFNCNTINASADGIDNYVNSLNLTHQDDFVAFALQESPESLLAGETYPERILKRPGNRPYVIFHQQSQHVSIPSSYFTNPFYLFNRSPKTILVLAYRKDTIKDRQVHVIASGEEIDDAYDHKGGFWVLFSINHKKFLFITGHFDSWSQDVAKDQIEKLLEAGFKAAHDRHYAIHVVKIFGDLNIRCSVGTVDKNNPVPGLYQAVNKFKEGTYFEKYNICPIKEATYDKGIDQVDPKRPGYLKYGALDVVFYKNATDTPVVSLMEEGGKVASICQSSRLSLKRVAVSDHKAVIQRFKVDTGMREEVMRFYASLTAEHLPHYQRIESFAKNQAIDHDTLQASILFVVNHLPEDRIPFSFLFSEYFFHACEKLDKEPPPSPLHASLSSSSAATEDSSYIRSTFNKILAKKAENAVTNTLVLLRPFHDYFKTHAISGCAYTVTQNINGYFVKPCSDHDTLTPLEENNLRK